MQVILSKLFKPKWKHANAEVRKQAVVRLALDRDEDRQILERLARLDEDAGVRCAAIERIDSLDTLCRLQEESTPDEVRQTLLRRCCELLTGESLAVEPAQALPLIARIQDAGLLTHLALNARRSEIAEAAIARIDDPLCLERIVLDAPAAAQRQNAAKRLEAPECLERLQRACKQKDKGIYRLVRDKLKTLRQQEAEAEALRAQAREVIDALQHLANTALFPLYEAKLNALVQRWEALPDDCRAAEQPTFAQAVERCRSQLAAQAEAEARAQRQQEAAEQAQSARTQWLGALAANLEIQQNRLTQGDTALELIASEPLSNDWTRLCETHPATSEERQRFKRLSEQVGALREAATRLGELDETLTNTLAQVPEVPEADSDPSGPRRTLHGLRQQLAWPSALPQPPLVAELEARYLRFDQAHRQRQRTLERDARELNHRLDELEQLLDGGEAGNALKLYRSLAPLAQLKGVPEEQLQRFKGLNARIQELKSWSQYAIAPKKEALCQCMEQLIDADLAPPLLAEQIKGLQREWKELDAQDHQHDQTLWKRFKEASDRAYLPCKAYQEAQREQRADNLTQRERICEQLQLFIDNTDWAAADWKLVEKLLHTAKQEWRQYSPVDRKPGQRLQERFNQQLQAIETPLDRARQQHAEQKAELVARTEALLQSDDLQAATEEAKRLQQQWKAIGNADRKQERQLWKAFRSACNRLFERRDEQRQVQRNARQAALADAKALLEALEALTPEAEAFKAQLNELRTRAQALDLPGKEGKQLDKRIQQRLDALKRASQQPRLNPEARAALEQRIELCRTLEAQLLDQEPPMNLEADQAAWRQAAKAPRPYRELLEARHEAALRLADEQQIGEQIDGAEKQLRLLCIRLEILAGVPSPESDQLLRMEYQMDRLQDALKQTEQPPEQVAQAVEELTWEWSCSPLDNRFPELEARFQSLAKSLS